MKQNLGKTKPIWKLDIKIGARRCIKTYNASSEKELREILNEKYDGAYSIISILKRGVK